MVWLFLFYFAGKKQETTKTSAVLQNLEACEEYLIDVAVVGPLGIGPMNSPKQILTEMDPAAPPKELRIHTTNEILSLLLTWNAPCPVLDKAIGYKVNKLDINTNARHSFHSGWHITIIVCFVCGRFYSEKLNLTTLTDWVILPLLRTRQYSTPSRLSTEDTMSEYWFLISIYILCFREVNTYLYYVW